MDATQLADIEKWDLYETEAGKMHRERNNWYFPVQPCFKVLKVSNLHDMCEILVNMNVLFMFINLIFDLNSYFVDIEKYRNVIVAVNLISIYRNLHRRK